MPRGRQRAWRSPGNPRSSDPYVRVERPAGRSPVREAGEDRSLVRRCLKGDERAFAQLVARYEGAIYRLAWRMMRQDEEAQDVVQETFMRVFRALHTYDQSRKFSTWILRICTNLCIDRYRRRRMKLLSIDASEQEEARSPIVLVDRGRSPFEAYQRSAMRAALDRLVQRLPPIYRAVIELRYQQSLSYDEISEVLGIPLGTVKARLHRAHRHLKELLEEAGIGPDEAQPD
ncbi:MAG: sigma-70 family RNA polymerase sigma factor [Candidatus Eisenbacteria bacterium]|nr:sigma-70 family RNA polymerase sigma factor [Candidatus Eisenbacteria bacterium]